MAGENGDNVKLRSVVGLPPDKLRQHYVNLIRQVQALGDKPAAKGQRRAYNRRCRQLRSELQTYFTALRYTIRPGKMPPAPEIVFGGVGTIGEAWRDECWR